MGKLRNLIGQLKDRIVSLFTTKKGLITLAVIIAVIFGLIQVVKITKKVYYDMNSTKLNCVYESAVSDYSKLKIKETVTNVFYKGKRDQVIIKTEYTILNKDKDTLNSMKTDKKNYVKTFEGIKGAKAKYKGKGYNISTTVTYKLRKMEKSKRDDLNFNLAQTEEEIKAYYEKEGTDYKCN